MFYTRLFYSILIFCVSSSVLSQSDLSMFNEFSLSFNHRVSNKYKINASLKGRNFVYENNEIFIKQRFAEIGHFSTLDMSPKHSISLGLMYRNSRWFYDLENEMRTTLQFNIKSIQTNNRFGHRFRAEQRFYESKTKHFLRYRLAFDTPLNGTELNIGESYFVSTTELLWSLASQEKPSIGNRWSAQIGWLLKQKSKLQFGLEYRFNDINLKTNYNLFFLTTAILNL